MPRTGAESGSNFSTMGGSVSLGNLARMVEILSRTSCAAASESRSRANTTVTRELPSVVLERSSSRPLMVFTDSSTSLVTCVSISSGLAPASLVVIVMVGRSIFGRRSKPRRS